MISIREIDFYKSVSNIKDTIILSSDVFGLPSALAPVVPVSVAVLDTGHPAHSGLQVQGVQAGKNCIDFVGNESLPWDNHGHATAVAGIISGKTDKFHGICSSALMYYVKCIGEDGRTSTKKISAGLLWSAAKQIEIAVVAAGSYDQDRHMDEVIAKCIQKGMIIIAAGKSNSSKENKAVFPGGCSGTISCSFDKTTSIKEKINGGFDVSIGHKSSWTLAPDERYIKLGGNSIATAIVAGFVCSHLASGMTKERLFEKMKDISSCH